MKHVQACLGLWLFLLPGLAAAQGGAQAGVSATERRAASTFFVSGGGATPMVVHGQLELTYGAPPWKDEYTAMLEEAKPGTRFRIGNNFWATFDTSSPIEVAGTRLEPGTYYLALLIPKPDEAALVFLDAAAIRKQKLHSGQTAETKGGIVVTLAWKEIEKPAKALNVAFRQIEGDGKAVELALQFGPFEMTARVAQVAEKAKPRRQRRRR